LLQLQILTSDLYDRATPTSYAKPMLSELDEQCVSPMLICTIPMANWSQSVK
jgi:hypothetical protein